MKKRICFMMLLMSCSLCLCLMSSTYSRYVAGTTGNIDILFAKWQILINSEDIADANNSTISFTPTIESNSYIKENTVAPTSNGYFDIDIDPTNVDVSFRYTIDLEIDNEDIPDLMITRYAILPNHYEEGDTIEYTTLNESEITNELLFDNETEDFSFEPFTIRVYFEWYEGVDEQMTDEDDTEIGIASANDDVTFTINANISFEQILQPENNENNQNNEIIETP